MWIVHILVKQSALDIAEREKHIPCRTAEFKFASKTQRINFTDEFTIF